MQNGWIKLHRKILNNSISSNPKIAWCWVRFLLEASHKEINFFIESQKVHLKPGQFVWGEKKWGRILRVSSSTARRIKDVLKNEDLIEEQTNNRFTLITVKKWEEYQQNKEQNEEQMKNKRRTDEEQMKTNKNDKNDKNKDIAANAADSLKEKRRKEQERLKQPMILQEFIDWCHKSPQRHIYLIGEYADTIKPNFKNRGQWESFIKRNLRPAKDLSPYDDDQIEKAMVEIQKAQGDGWLKKYTLETLTKFLK